MFAGLTREQAAELLGVSLRTVGHWETGRARPAFAAFKLLRVLRHGDLIDPAWSAFAIVRGRLVTPEGHAFAPWDLTWLSLLVRRAHAFGELVRERDAANGASAPVVAARAAERDAGDEPEKARHRASGGARASCGGAVAVPSSGHAGGAREAGRGAGRFTASIEGTDCPTTNRGVSRSGKPQTHSLRLSAGGAA